MNTYSNAELRRIARVQRQVLMVLLISIPVVGLSMVPLPTGIAEHAAVPIFAAFLLIGVTGAVLIYRLARALGDPVAWLYGVCAFIPYVSTATLLILNMRASAVLKANGIEVGLMGAREVPSSAGEPEPSPVDFTDGSER